jgi:hypothetical protein
VQGDQGVSLPCPHCHGSTKVVEVRLRGETQDVRRRRECARPCLDANGLPWRGTAIEVWRQDESDEALDQTMPGVH